jgi:hypothetical protein
MWRAYFMQASHILTTQERQINKTRCHHLTLYSLLQARDCALSSSALLLVGHRSNAWPQWCMAAPNCCSSKHAVAQSIKACTCSQQRHTTHNAEACSCQQASNAAGSCSSTSVLMHTLAAGQNNSQQCTMHTAIVLLCWMHHGNTHASTGHYSGLHVVT